MNIKKTFPCFALAIGFTLIPVIGFYWHCERFAQSLVSDLKMDKDAANAVKHSYAAAQVTVMLNTFLSDRTSENIVLFLGFANEYLEQIIKLQKDSASEVFKDLHNNQVGITVALSHQSSQSTTNALKTSILILAKSNKLILRGDMLSAPPIQPALKHIALVKKSIADFKANKISIKTDIEAELKKTQ